MHLGVIEALSLPRKNSKIGTKKKASSELRVYPILYSIMVKLKDSTKT